MRFINDDFPNCNVAGEDFLVITYCPVAKGESLTMDYGVGHVSLKWGRYLLGKKDALRSYFSAESLRALWKKVAGRPQKGEEMFQTLERQEKCLYLYQTPAAALCAILSQTVKVEEMIDALKAPERKTYWASRISAALYMVSKNVADLAEPRIEFKEKQGPLRRNPRLSSGEARYAYGHSNGPDAPHPCSRDLAGSFHQGAMGSS